MFLKSLKYFAGILALLSSLSVMAIPSKNVPSFKALPSSSPDVAVVIENKVPICNVYSKSTSIDFRNNFNEANGLNECELNTDMVDMTREAFRLIETNEQLRLAGPHAAVGGVGCVIGGAVSVLAGGFSKFRATRDEDQNGQTSSLDPIGASAFTAGVLGASYLADVALGRGAINAGTLGLAGAYMVGHVGCTLGVTYLFFSEDME